MVAARAAIAILTALAVACGGGGTSLTRVPPPRSWSDDLRLARAAKDASYARDDDSPIPSASRPSFRGLLYFEADPSWRYAGFVERYPRPEPFTIVTTRGDERPCERWGRVSFEREGRVVTLQVYRLLDLPERAGGEGLFLPFKDGTSGNETYGAGRYLDLTGPAGGPFTVDFNRAYAPSCAYGDVERFRCPVTPAENTLPLRVEAGERTR